MSSNGLPDVTGAPSIIIGGTTYTLRWSQLAQFELSESGYTISQMLDVILKAGEPRAHAYSYRLFAAMVAHNFIDKGLPIPDARFWASVIPNEKVAELFSVIREALLNAKLIVTLNAPAAPVAEPEKNEPSPVPQPS